MHVAAYGLHRFEKGGTDVVPVLAGAVRDLLGRNGRVDRSQVGAVLVSTNDNSKYLGPLLSEAVGIRPAAAHTVESLCSSGGSALASGYAYVASGMAEAVIVAGAELRESPGAVLGRDMARGEFASPVHWGSLFTRAYRRASGASAEEIARVPAKNSRQAAANPAALGRRPCTVRDVLESRRITDDLRLLECSEPCTGGAAVMLASGAAAREISDAPVRISGVGQSTVSAGIAGAGDLHLLESARRAGAAALGMAKREPSEIGVAEVHDAFAACEPMALEALGLAGPGRGAEMVAELDSARNPMVNPRGGLLGAGHPLGATGIAQAAEVAAQLRGEAGPRQADSPQAGLVHNMSAAATSSTVLVLER